ncbi:hypothetical protein ACFQ1M_05635 [Sungkyunkwania multivorans]|uniref:Uncharacterized protein n=1 Tax=Sungkyunkwania multivorans TaxID=1173618 RepID=A0ABW3CYG9_9FLAO
METKTATPKATTYPNTASGITKRITDELVEETHTMLAFALKNGIAIDKEVTTLASSNSFEDLMSLHALLVQNVAPATPKSISYLEELQNNEREKSFFSKLPILRNLILLTLVFLALFIGTGLSPNVNNDSVAKGIMDNQGLNLLLNLAFIASASGLGVLFSMLRNVTIGIKKGTLVPEDSIYYSALIILGIIAGLIISEIIPFNSLNGNNTALFNNVALALIGGFSSDAIFAILQSVVNKLKQIFSTPNS